MNITRQPILLRAIFVSRDPSVIILKGNPIPAVATSLIVSTTLVVLLYKTEPYARLMRIVAATIPIVVGERCAVLPKMVIFVIVTQIVQVHILIVLLNGTRARQLLTGMGLCV